MLKLAVELWLCILPLNSVVVIHYDFVDLASREPKVGGGIYQWSGLEKVTKWDIVKLIAQHTGLRLVIPDHVDVPCALISSENWLQIFHIFGSALLAIWACCINILSGMKFMECTLSILVQISFFLVTTVKILIANLMSSVYLMAVCLYCRPYFQITFLDLYKVDRSRIIIYLSHTKHEGMSSH